MAVLPLNSMMVGYRFRPTDYELVNHFLRLKITGNEEAVGHIREVDLCKQEPWDLPDMSLIETNDDEWIFFCPIDRKYKSGKRSNRATVGGYWKATGNDRLIKSVTDTTVIGTKKTLVFYSGRAPIGQKTNWIIHEYRTTIEDLDGTKAGQGSFVLCKLMKKRNKKVVGKQVETTEGLNRDEVQEIVFSPNTFKSFSEDMQSEPVTPVTMSSTQDEKIPCSIENADAATLGVPLPAKSPNYCRTADDPGDKSIDQNSEVEDMLMRLFPSPNMEPSDVHQRILLPLNAQMEAELGSGYNLHYPVANEVGHDQKGVRFLSESNEEEINELIDSFLVSPEEYLCEDSESCNILAVETEAAGYVNHNIGRDFCEDTVSCSELDTIVAQAQNDERMVSVPAAMSAGAYGSPDKHLRSLVLPEIDSLEQHFVTVASSSDRSYGFVNNLGVLSNNSNAIDDGHSFETGIRLRTRQPHYQRSATYSGFQGSAPRRIRLQKKLHIGSFSSSNFRDFNYEEENHKAESVIAKQAEEKHNATVGPAAIIDESQDAFFSPSINVLEISQEAFFSPSINVLEISQEAGSNWKSRNAPRRVQLQKKLQVGSSPGSNFGDFSYKEENHEAKAIVAKLVEEKHTATVSPAAIIDESQDAFFSPSINALEISEEAGLNSKSRNAPRRIQLQKKLQVGSSSGSNFRDFSYKEENHEAKSIVAKAEEKHTATAGPAAIIDESLDAFFLPSINVIEISQEASSNPKSRNAPRRIQLQMKLQVGSSSGSNFRDFSYKEENHEAKSILAKPEEKHTATVESSSGSSFRDISYKEENHEAKSIVAKQAEEKHTPTVGLAAIIDDSQNTSFSASISVIEISQQAGSNPKSRSVTPKVCDKEALFASFESPPPAVNLISLSMHLRWLFMVVGLSILSVGIWRCLEFPS